MAFLLEPGRRGTTQAEFMREIEEEGIKFNIENTAEDIVNGLFCTYEPPTSKMDQFRAAKQARRNPKKYLERPSVPKSILKWKVKKQKKQKKHFPAPPSEAPSVAPTTVTTETRDDVMQVDGEKKSVTWRDEKGKKGRTEIENKVVDFSAKYCGGVCNSGAEEIADILSSPTGREVQNFFSGDAETPGSMASMASSILKASPTSANSNKKILYDDLGNPIREDEVSTDGNGSYFPSTPASTAPAPTPMGPRTRADDLKEDHSNLFCSNIPFMDTVKEGIGIAGVMAATAAVAAGVPENLCSSYTKKRTEETELQQQAKEAFGIYEPESYDQLAPTVKLNRQATPRHARIPTKDEEESQNRAQRTPSNRSYAQSDITMGNTTVKHFSANTSLFDDTVAAAEPSPKIDFSNMVRELKEVQVEKGLEGSSQYSQNDNISLISEEYSTTSGPSVSSLRKGYLKSPKNFNVTRSYLHSIKSPKSNGSKVSEMARKWESPRANSNPVPRKSIDPVESRHFDGKMNFLPPTPRRKMTTPVSPSSGTVSQKINKFDLNLNNNNNKNSRQDETTTGAANKSTPAAVSVSTDDEIREAASSVVDVTKIKTVENSETPEEQQQQQQDSSATKKKSKKEKKSKSKESKSKEGGFFKKIRKVTKNFESQRIASD